MGAFSDVCWFLTPDGWVLVTIAGLEPEELVPVGRIDWWPA